MMLASLLQTDANSVAILGFVILAVGAIIGPWLGSRKSIRDMNKPNGATKKAGLPVSDYSDYNLYDLCLQSLVNSKQAMEDAAAAAALASSVKNEIGKVVKHLGIEGSS